MCIYKNILDSYRTGEGWNVPFLSPQQMAFVGLRYTGVDAIVICDYCNVVFKHWVRGVDPYIRHKMASPNCTSYENKSGVYHAVSLEWSNSLQKLQRQFIHTEFASFESRLSTFEKCKRQLYQDPRSLCEAGFFYTGNGKNDEFMCFCCSVRLIDWKRTDDPWVEHARVFPTCSYLLLTKSKSFVVTVHQLIQKYSNLDCFNETLIDSLSSNPDQAFKMTLRKRRPINVTTTVQKKKKKFY
ncbi:baculoviral IAP repeat-containing protein 2-like [Sipha flava]|uniref:Baculoviral IAP repeat-containing protein 2-like n=1 Tax=Sipha flava TaxID=143950 RepID=A0A8B8G5X6_9HEMI|nr:baculoviral IAP repeat-containing protein 2-like [Sipha flava]